MKRLSGWDAVLLYSEAPNVHMHTIKVAVIELDPASRGFTIDAFRQVIAGRMDKLVPLGYQLIDVPFKFHHPMWRENCEVDFEYHIRPWRLPAPGGRRELDEAIGQIASTPLDRAHPLWEMYFVEGLANDRIAVVLKIHHALADGVASANLMARGMDLLPAPRGRPLHTRPGAHQAGAGGHRRSSTTCATSGGSPRRSATPRKASAGSDAARASSHRN